MGDVVEVTREKGSRHYDPGQVVRVSSNYMGSPKEYTIRFDEESLIAIHGHEATFRAELIREVATHAVSPLETKGLTRHLNTRRGSTTIDVRAKHEFVSSCTWEEEPGGGLRVEKVKDGSLAAKKGIKTKTGIPDTTMPLALAFRMLMNPSSLFQLPSALMMNL